MDKQYIYKEGSALLQKVRECKPIVHHMTNYVTVNDCANIVLALGGSPIMADEKKELHDIGKLSNALVLNIGTINDSLLEGMKIAAVNASERKIPIILDPVGAGASTYRTAAVDQLLSSINPTVIRGNLSEIKSVAHLSSHTSGVDSSPVDEAQGISHAIEVAKQVAQDLNCVVAVSGKSDIITDGKQVVLVENGDVMLTRITGTGCMSTSMIATLCAISSSPFLASIVATAAMGIAGERASEKRGMGTFHSELFNIIGSFDGKELEKWGALNVR